MSESRETTQQAEWKYDKDGDFFCSACEQYPPLMRETPYCPKCGKKMKGNYK